MIIKVDNSNRKKIDNLLLEKQMNIAAADLLFDFCFYSKEHHYHSDITKEEIFDYLELNPNDKEDLYFFNSRILPSITKIDVSDYIDNYYRDTINPKPYKTKEYEIKYLTFDPYQCFPYDDIKIDNDYKEVSKIGYFTNQFKYLAILKKDVVWMSTDPNEINTMKASIETAHGDVVAFGLGLGYFPIMAAHKSNVKSVTIIEKDPQIIDIFSKFILPLCPEKDKIRVIYDDAFNFAKSGKINNYDFLFIDIWHNPEDGLPLYLEFKKILKGKNIEIHYWLEKSILAMYRRCLLTVVEESLLGYSDKDYKIAKNDYDKIINDIYFKTKDLTINSYEDLLEILQDRYILNLL